MLPIWKNLGFFFYIVIYFHLTDSIWNWPTANLSTVTFKILPLFHILVIILSTASEINVESKAAKRYQWMITAGLILSAVGDTALVYKEDRLSAGLAAFTLSQLLYILAFGFKPFGSGPTATTFAVLGVSFYTYILDRLKNRDLITKSYIAGFTLLACVLVWRALVRFLHRRSTARFVAVIGSISLVAAEFILALEVWHGKIPRAPMWVMLTYYLGQLFIGLSACDQQDFKEKAELEDETRASVGGVKSGDRQLGGVKLD